MRMVQQRPEPRLGNRIYLNAQEARFKRWYMVVAETASGVIIGHLDHGLVSTKHVLLLKREDFCLIAEIRQSKVHPTPAKAG